MPSVPVFESAEAVRTAEIPPRTWFIDGFLTPGLALLVGKKGNGKSFFAMQAAAAIASGRPFLGRAVVRSRIAYAFLELDRTAVHERLVRMGPQDPGFLVCYSWPRGFEGIEAAEAAFRDEGIQVLILDMLSGILPMDADSNSYDLSAFLLGWRRLAHQYGACVVFVHHAGKAPRDDPMDAALGSTALAGQADSVLLLERKRTESAGRLFALGNHGKETSLSLHFEDCTWTGGDPVIPNGPTVADADKPVLKLLQDTPGGLKAPEVAALIGRGENATRATLSRLKFKGLVLKFGNTWTVPHEPHESAPRAQGAPGLFGSTPHEPHRPL